jgi:predicted metallopeptidase
MAVVYSSMPELKKVAEALKAKFEELDHIKPDRILYLSFSKPKSSFKAKIGPIAKRFAHLFPSQEYFLEIHQEAWDAGPEGDRLYTMLHELLHIPEEGFVAESKSYRRVKKHDVQDFAALLQQYGILQENVDKLEKKVK